VLYVSLLHAQTRINISLEPWSAHRMIPGIGYKEPIVLSTGSDL
jgi:hypothetical protein